VPLHLLVGLPLLARLGHADTKDPALAAIYIVVGTFASYAVAVLSYHAFEVHFLRMKGRLAARPALAAGR
jgi:peptidoglycan/LPS O-acetylase OafA/YrhL